MRSKTFLFAAITSLFLLLFYATLMVYRTTKNDTVVPTPSPAYITPTEILNQPSFIPLDPSISPKVNPVEDEAKQLRVCIAGGGKWIVFANGCVDRCGKSDMCTQALTNGCDCGNTKCWDGYKCIAE